MVDFTMVDGIPSYAKHDDGEIKGFFGPYSFLSNFYPASLYYEGLYYPSAEHAYQAAKSLDEAERKAVLRMTAAGAKSWGQKVALRSDWEDIKYEVMCSIVFEKYYRNPHLRKLLLNTESKYLEETNHWRDSIWGVNYKTGVGKNWLGKISTRTREFWQ